MPRYARNDIFIRVQRFTHTLREASGFSFAQMKLQINGEERTFSDVSLPFTLASLLEALGMKADRVAIELNRDIVPRDRWAETQLNEGDRLEVVHFVGGGSYQDLASAMPWTVN